MLLFSEWVKGQPGTRAEVAVRLGVSRDTVHKLMRGQVFPRRSTRAAIARETGGAVTVDALSTAYNDYYATKG